ncbi:MAG: DUF4199 domain-containing protein [Muribaculaceae bacterium]
MDKDEANTPQAATPVQLAANYGLWFGIYLSGLFLMFVGADNSAFMSMIALVMFFLSPAVVLRMLRGAYRSNAASDFFRLWSIGVMIFFFASLICALVTVVWIQYVHPDFIYDKAQEAIDVYRTLPELANSDIVNALQAAINKGELPTPIEFAMQMGWTTVMIGSVVSVPLALLARLRFRRH